MYIPVSLRRPDRRRIAFLYLNEDGFDRLLLDELDFSDPDPAILIRPGATPAALYVWALAARTRRRRHRQCECAPASGAFGAGGLLRAAIECRRRAPSRTTRICPGQQLPA
jgi:hypothetical protein